MNSWRAAFGRFGCSLSGHSWDWPEEKECEHGWKRWTRSCSRCGAMERKDISWPGWYAGTCCFSKLGRDVLKEPYAAVYDVAQKS